MIISKIISGLILTLFFIYLILGFMAYSNIEHKRNDWLISFPLWFLRSDIYNDFGKRLCPIGKVLFTLILVVAVLWTSLF